MQGKLAALRREFREPLFRNAYALMLNTVVNSALGAGFWLLAANLYTPAEVGVDNALLSLVLFVSTLTQLNFGQALIRFLPVAGLRSALFLRRAYLISVMLCVVVASALAWYCHTQLQTTSSFSMSKPLAVWFVVVTAGWSIFNLQDAALTGLRVAIWIPLENGVYGVVKLLMLAGFAMATFSLSHEIFLAATLPLLGFLLTVNILMWKLVIPRHETSTAAYDELPTSRGLAKYMSGDFLGQIFTQLSSTFLPVVVVLLLGKDAAGYLLPAQTIWIAMNMLSLAITSSLVVESARDPSRASYHARAMLKRICVIVVPISLLIAIFAYWLLYPFGREYATESTTILRLFMLSVLARVVMALWTSKKRLHNQTVQLASVLGMQAAILLGGTVLFADSLGLSAVGWSALASQLFPALLFGHSVFRWLWPQRSATDSRNSA